MRRDESNMTLKTEPLEAKGENKDIDNCLLKEFLPWTSGRIIHVWYRF
jgi:hypothetical protein